MEVQNIDVGRWDLSKERGEGKSGFLGIVAGKEKEIEEAIAKYEEEKTEVAKADSEDTSTTEQSIGTANTGVYVRLTSNERMDCLYHEQKVGYSKGDFYVMTTQVTQKFGRKLQDRVRVILKVKTTSRASEVGLIVVIFANMLSEKLGLEKVYEIPKELTLGSSQSDDLAKKV